VECDARICVVSTHILPRLAALKGRVYHDKVFKSNS